MEVACLLLKTPPIRLLSFAMDSVVFCTRSQNRHRARRLFTLAFPFHLLAFKYNCKALYRYTNPASFYMVLKLLLIATSIAMSHVSMNITTYHE